MIRVYHDIVQGTPEWHALRAGKPTASCFGTVLAQGRTKGSPSVTRRKYQLELIGQQLTGSVVTEGYSNAAMERGKAMEAEARKEYAFLHDKRPVPVGFVEQDFGRWVIGASPDSLVDEDGQIEIKTMLPHILLEVILADEMPSEHVAQVQGQLMVTGRKWCDFIGYWPGLPTFVKRIYPDIDYHAKLRIGLQDFLTEMDQLRAKVQA